MRKILLVLFLYSSVYAEDFISDFEYGQLLYRDSRGVSCVPCHGETGGGADIVSYKDKKGKTTIISGPDIRHATLKQISNSLKKGKGVMPKYFLTDKEIAMIHAYLKEVNSENNESQTDG